MPVQYANLLEIAISKAPWYQSKFINTYILILIVSQLFEFNLGEKRFKCN